MEKFIPRRIKRLKGYNYSLNGAYFLTLCTKSMNCCLSSVGRGVLDTPIITLSEYGKVVENRLREIESKYDNIILDDYVIMPNHIHILLRVDRPECFENEQRAKNHANEIVPSFVSTLKRMTNKELGIKIWEERFHDHIIRNERDYLMHWQYIDENPKKWLIGKDKYYSL